MIHKQEEINALLYAAARINNEICENVGYPYANVPVISVTLVPTTNIVAYHNIFISVNIGQDYFTIYRSDTDDRIYYEKSDTYESWYKYIRRKWKTVREDLADITL